MKRIHIVGVSPRTGTTLLVECMRACFAIDAFEDHEAPLWKHRRGVRVYLTKFPGDIQIVRPRLLVDPALHVIAMIRDPRDVIVSRHGLDSNRYWAPLWYWMSRAHLLKRLRRHKRFILVRYEDLVRDPNWVQDRLSQAMPFLGATGRFSDFAIRAAPSDAAKKALGGVRSIGTDRIGGWRGHLARVAGQVSRHGSIAKALIEYGYESDDRWLAQLEGIEPDSTPSHLPDVEPALWRTRLRRFRAYLEALRWGQRVFSTFRLFDPCGTWITVRTTR